MFRFAQHDSAIYALRLDRILRLGMRGIWILDFRL
jgi:hypothetical protein